jgi:5-methylcytosine-specific restriction endonuclease McrA
MKGLDWGGLYDEYGKKKLNLKKINAEYDELMLDDDVTNKKGIYPYILTRNPKYLSIRQFTPAQKMKAYKAQKGICSKCKKHFELDEMEADHITPWAKGGKTTPENCQMLCKACNRKKSDV